jgi:cobalt/nickel transport system permease protein
VIFFFAHMTLTFAPLPCPDSLLRRFDPRWKLAAALLLLTAIILLRGLTGAAGGLAFALTLVAVAKMPCRWYLGRIAPLGLFLAFFLITFPLFVRDKEPLLEIGNLTISWSGLKLALIIASKAIALVSIVLVLLVSSPLDQTLAAAHSLRVPGLLIQTTLLAYHYLYLLSSEARRLLIAVRVRGYRQRLTAHSYRTMAHIAGAVLVRGHDRAERVAQAMRCRGFDGRFRCLERFRTGLADVLGFAFITGVALGLLGLDWATR